MGKLLVRIIKNKRNGQININIPRKQLDVDSKRKIDIAKKAWISLEDFE